LLDNDNGESFFFEFKEDGVRNEQLHKEISAFANTYGGYILLGITDKKNVSGCAKWTEERIHNVIYNNITPTPDFDVRQFQIDGNTVFVIKIEEGSMPPYITSDGKIFERVSSSSMPIRDSAKLSQLYTKRSDSLVRLHKKIGIDELRIHQGTPFNLCAYLDLGFEIQCMDKDKVRQSYVNFDYASIAEQIKNEIGSCSITKVGYSRVVTFGNICSGDNQEHAILPDANMHTFIVLMDDGSVKCRICLFADKDGMTEISSLITSFRLFREMYSKIFRDSIESNFIYARKYEKLVVIKQFTPYYRVLEGDDFDTYLRRHIDKYGNNLIVNGNRIPDNDFDLLDKRYFDRNNLEYHTDSIIEELFRSAHLVLGYIDIPEVSDDDEPLN